MLVEASGSALREADEPILRPGDGVLLASTASNDHDNIKLRLRRHRSTRGLCTRAWLFFECQLPRIWKVSQVIRLATSDRPLPMGLWPLAQEDAWLGSGGGMPHGGTLAYNARQMGATSVRGWRVSHTYIHMRIQYYSSIVDDSTEVHRRWIAPSAAAHRQASDQPGVTCWRSSRANLKSCTCFSSPSDLL